MYYDLIASLPHLPHFSKADHLPITPLRLQERLKPLTPSHIQQLQQAIHLVRWWPDRFLDRSDRDISVEFSELMALKLDSHLRDYIDFRMEQRVVLAALRWKHQGVGVPQDDFWNRMPRFRYLRQHWDEMDFHLTHTHRWLSEARDRLVQGDVLGLERLLMETSWGWLGKCADRSTFGFPAVFAYVFKWDILRCWLSCNADRAKDPFTKLINKVTHAERS